MKTCIALSAVLLAACSTTLTPDYDQRFGDAVRQARTRQTLNPTASANPDPVLGLDGKAAQEGIHLYHDSFKSPPPVVNVINIGGGVSSR
jgi:predicted Zn-dependent protease